MRVGWEQSASGDMEGAIGTYQRLIAVAPDNAEVHNNLGVIHFRQREYSKAKTYFETALTLDANYDEAHANLNYVRRERIYGAIKQWVIPVAIILLAAFTCVKVISRRRKMMRPKPM